MDWQEGVPDVVMGLGETPVSIDETQDHLQRQALPGVALMRVSDYRFLVREGHEIVVQPLGPLDPAVVNLYLLGGLLTLVLHQRGGFPFHAGSVIGAQGGVCFTGESGAGKSTMVAYLQAAGYLAMGDDLAVMRIGDDGVSLLKGLNRVKLLPDALSGLQVPGREASLGSVRADGKLHLALSMPGAQDEVPVTDIVTLVEGAEVSLQRLTGLSAFRVVHINIHRASLRARMLGAAEGVQTCQRLCAKVRVWRLARPKDFGRFGESLQLLQAAGIL